MPTLRSSHPARSRASNSGSFTPAGSQAVRLGTEYACKKLAGKNADFTDDPTYHGKPRKFGADTRAVPDRLSNGQALLVEASCRSKVALILGYEAQVGE